MPAATIRRATAADVEAVQACVNAAYSHYPERMGGLMPGPMLGDYAAGIRNHDAYVLEIEGAPAGILVLQHSDDGFLLDNVAVHPEFQKRGLGRRLIAFAEDEARRVGFEAISLYTHVSMTENIALYESLGYVEVERAWVGPYERVLMRKPLL